MGNRWIEVKKRAPEVTEIILNRPEKRNAILVEMMKELSEAIRSAHHDLKGRILILRGAGPVFCAGLDYEEIADPNSSHPTETWISEILELLALTPLLTIGVGQGAAIASGATLLAACDFAFGSEGLQISFPESHFGLVPSLVTALLYRRIGDRPLRELMILGNPVSAKRAVEIGLLTRVVPADQLEHEVDQFVQSLLKTAPIAAAQTKRLIQELRYPNLKEELRKVAAYHLQARVSEEAEEGISAFLEGRAPKWTPQP